MGLSFILIVLSALTLQAPRPGRLVEEARWGGTESDTLIASLPAVAALHRSGALVVLMPQIGRVLLRQPRQPFRQLGRSGKGPGEYVRPVGAGWQGDSLWIWDSGVARLTWLDSHGKVLRSEQGRAGAGIHPLPDGTWLRFPPSSLEDTSATVELVGRDRAAPKRIVTYSWPRAPALEIKLQGSSIVGVQHFADRATISVDPVTSDLLVLEPIPSAGVRRFRRVSPTGRLLMQRQLALPTQPLTDAHFNAFLRFWRESGASSVPEAVLRKALYRPSHLPVVRGQLVADDGTLWLQAGPETATLTTWIVLDRGGRAVRQITGPPSLKLLAVTAGMVIGALTDELGLVSLVQYRVDR